MFKILNVVLHFRVFAGSMGFYQAIVCSVEVEDLAD